MTSKNSFTKFLTTKTKRKPNSLQNNGTTILKKEKSLSELSIRYKSELKGWDFPKGKFWAGKYNYGDLLVGSGLSGIKTLNNNTYKNKLTQPDMDQEITPERYFFIYAFPVLKICTDLEKEELIKLKRIYMQGEAPSKRKLKKLFPAAFERLRQIAKPKSRYWTLENLIEYWRNGGHNRFVPKPCQTHQVKLARVNKNNTAYYRRDNGEKRVEISPYLNRLQKCDEVTVHFERVIEKI